MKTYTTTKDKNEVEARAESKVDLTQISTAALQIVYGLGYVIKYFFIMVIFVVAAGYGLSLLNNAESYSLARPILFYDQKLTDIARQLIPVSIKGFDLTRVFLILAAIAAKMIVDAVSMRAINYVEYFKVKETIDELHLPNNVDTIPDLGKKLESIKHGGKGNRKQGREELLKILGDVQRNLDSMKRNVAFLAIDVVDSTGMKVGEDSTKIEVDFMEYKNLVEKAFKDNDYLKAAWTPDGVMSCFKTPNAAVKAGVQVINDLRVFNKNRKTIKRDFIVRCGANAGTVAYDEHMPMEQMSDHVIDIAGHFQKYSPKGAICVTKAVYDELLEKKDFTLTKKKIDDLDSYVYNIRLLN